MILGQQNKISESNQLMRIHPWVPGIENHLEKSIVSEKLELIWFFEVYFVKST